ncbi:MAG: alpha/beta hydrolase [Gemmatimonadales bacterium]
MQEHRIPVIRTARYFTLGTFSGAVGEVWFVLHGYGQLAARFLRSFEPLDDGSRMIVAPEALSRFYVDGVAPPHQKVGATWMTREDRLTEIEDYVRYLDAVFTDVFRRVERGTRRVCVLGFSQGTATACRWLAQGSARADRLILWAGEVPPDLDLTAARDRLRDLDLTFVAGQRDGYITPKILSREEERLRSAGIPYRIVTFDGGHEIDGTALRGLAGPHNPGA